MKKALLFRDDEEPVLVSAEEIKAGIYSRHEEFVDPRYEFRVQYVSGARNQGGPYFRFYYSYEEYKKLYPERASRYEIVANMRRYEESSWHKKWKKIFSEFCVIEKCIKDEKTHKRKYADAFFEKTKTCIEFQHSYISFDFEERNAFYSQQSIKTIWLYDLPSANVRQDEQGNLEILENNAKGFFRISENPENLKNHRVYIQVKSGMIFRVKELLRRESSTEHQSTIRYFSPTEIYTEDEFVEAIKSNRIGTLFDFIFTKDSNDECEESNSSTPKPLWQLWNPKYSWMRAKNTKNGNIIFVNRGIDGDMFRDFETGCIKYKFVDERYSTPLRHKKEYCLSHREEKEAVWIMISCG